MGAPAGDRVPAWLRDVYRTAHTAEASTVHEPIGKPGGPGLWHHKTMQLPAYIQHVAHHLIAQGHDESTAIEEAVGIVKNWAAGHDGHGRHVHPDVQAAAAKNIADWEALKAKAHASTGTRRSAVADNKPYGDVRYADPKNGKYPIDTEAHARAALAYISMPKNAAMYPLNGVTLTEVKDRIKAACKKFGIDVAGDSSSSDSSSGASRSELMRDYPLEDLTIIRSGDGGDGRTMEAFAAVFNTETEIKDPEGHYRELIEPAAFNKRLADLKRARQGVAQVKVMFNHGRDTDGRPAAQFAMPVAVPVSIEATPRGLLTRSRFVATPLGDEVLELVRSGAVTSMSFTGRIVRSEPSRGRYTRYTPDKAGQLTTVRRMELGLREYGPVLFPAYEGAEINGVRMAVPGAWDAPDDDELDAALLPDAGAAAGEPPTPDGAGHLARYHQHALYVLRSQEARQKAGLVW
jgi:HK97 family phage prohead protease